MTVPAFIEARRSIRAFRADRVPAGLLDTLVAAACLAPAPHHSRPWRWVVLADRDRRAALADGMGARWRRDLRGDGVPQARIDELVAGSRERLVGAPAALLGCLTDAGLDRYPDEARQRAEWGMALLALGAGVENLMLSATALGLASCWVAAPIFCPAEAAAALDLDPTWQPHALVLVGYPDPAYRARERPAVDLETMRLRLVTDPGRGTTPPSG